MKPSYIFYSTLVTLCNAQMNPRANDVSNELGMPSQPESLIESVQLQASSVVHNIQSAYSHAATAVPTGLIEDMQELFPTQNPTAGPSSDGASPDKASYFGLTLGLAVVAVFCSALG